MCKCWLLRPIESWRSFLVFFFQILNSFSSILFLNFLFARCKIQTVATRPVLADLGDLSAGRFGRTALSRVSMVCPLRALVAPGSLASRAVSTNSEPASHRIASNRSRPCRNASEHQEYAATTCRTPTTVHARRPPVGHGPFGRSRVTMLAFDVLALT